MLLHSLHSTHTPQSFQQVKQCPLTWRKILRQWWDCRTLDERYSGGGHCPAIGKISSQRKLNSAFFTVTAHLVRGEGGRITTFPRDFPANFKIVIKLISFTLAKYFMVINPCGNRPGYGSVGGASYRLEVSFHRPQTHARHLFQKFLNPRSLLGILRLPK